MGRGASRAIGSDAHLPRGTHSRPHAGFCPVGRVRIRGLKRVSVETTGSGAVPTAACGRVQQTLLQAFAGAMEAGHDGAQRHPGRCGDLA